MPHLGLLPLYPIPRSARLFFDSLLIITRIGFNPPGTPSSTTSSANNEPPEFVSRPRDVSDDEDDGNHSRQKQGGNTPRKKSTYDSRIEQILCERPDLPILITDAGKSQESGGSYIVYTIRTGVCWSSDDSCECVDN